MNAYELADELENLFNRFLHPHSKFQDFLNAATMLRQQADRIAELEGVLSTYEIRDLNNTSRISKLEKDLHMIERHYDQLDTQLHPRGKE